MSVFLGEQDIEQINQTLASVKKNRHGLVNSVIRQTENTDALNLVKQVFQPDLFFYSTQPLTKEVVIDTLVTKIEMCEQQPIYSSFIKQLKLRETYSSVVFSEYLAVPHPIEPLTNKAYVAIGVFPNGVRWKAHSEAIQLVFLLSPDIFGQTDLSQVSALFVSVIEKDSFRQALVNCSTFEQFLEVFIRQFNK